MANHNLQRTMKQLKEQKTKCDIVERFCDNSKVPHKSDLFGIFDIIAMDKEKGIIGIQSCGGNDFFSHYKKIIVDRRDMALMWLYCGGKIELWGWRLVQKVRGKKWMIYKPRIQNITMNDFKKYFINNRGKSIICMTCGKESHNPNDVREKYCGYCHKFHDEKSINVRRTAGD